MIVILRQEKFSRPTHSKTARDGRGPAKTVSEEMSRFLLNTNVLSGIGNKRAGWQRIAGKMALYGQHRCVLSAITWHELRYGIVSNANP